jgi:glycosyltransferase involved in cell wall biosynthesis
MNRSSPLVCVVGPVAPYRGGIAQYTDSLVSAFRSTNQPVVAFSFKRQYPAFLYPGETDKSAEAHFQNDTRYTLDSNNPVTWFRAAKEIASTRPKIVYISWWTIFWQPAFMLMTRYLQKKGVKVIYLCHNVYDHDASALKKALTKRLIRYAGGYLVHSREQEVLLREITPDAPILVRQHPVYDIFPKPTTKRDTSAKLKLLFIGLIRPYKGLDVLLEAIEKTPASDRKNMEFSVVGEYWGDKEELAERLDDLEIKHELRFVSDQEMVDYIARSDAVVLPYKSATGSGIIPVSYYCGKPVVATNVGGLAEVVKDGKTGWLTKPGDAADLSGTLRKLSTEKCRSMSVDIKAWVKENSWEAMAASLSAEFDQAEQARRNHK